MLATTETRVIRPNPGPQERFLSTAADIAIFGSGAGTGKSFATLLDPLRHVHRPRFAAVMFRRETRRLIGAGSLWEESQSLYPQLGARSRQSPSLEWRFPSGATIELHHLQYDSDKHAHQGKQYAAIYWDEICEFEEGQFWFLLSRARTPSGIRPYVRATCNPDPDSFVRRLIDWWIGEDGYAVPERSGVLRWFVRTGDDLVWYDSREAAISEHPGRSPLSLTFIPATLSDNPKGDPTYRERLEALPRVDRERMLGGNWNIRASAGEVFQRSWFDTVAVRPGKARRVRSWDFAASEVSPTNPDPDWTVGSLLAETPDKHLFVEHIERFRGTQAKVEAAVFRMAEQDGKSVSIVIPEDPGAAGKNEAARLVRLLTARGFIAHARRITSDKLTQTKPLSARAENRGVTFVKGPWNEAALAELEAFCEKQKSGHDDIVDSLSLGNQALSRPAVRYAPATADIDRGDDRYD